MFIDLNGNNNKVVENIDLNLDDAFLFLGSNVFGSDQATGYYNYFMFLFINSIFLMFFNI